MDYEYDQLVRTLRSSLERARDKLNEQHQELVQARNILDELTQGPFLFATVLGVRDHQVQVSSTGNMMVNALMQMVNGADPPEDRRRMDVRKTMRLAVISIQGNRSEVGIPSHIEVRRGDVVRIDAKRSMFVDVVAEPQYGGEVAIVRTVCGNDACEVEYSAQTRMVLIGRHAAGVEPGDRVILDDSHNVAVVRLGNEGDSTDAYGGPAVDWNDVGGQDAAKAALRDAIELPFLHPSVYAAYNRAPTKGVLLYGPPGCGKTLLARAAATSVAKVHGDAAARTGFIAVSATQILTKWVGESESRLRELFARARRHRARFGFPAVIYIDEADAVFGRRDRGHVGGMETTIVPTYLAEVDGMKPSDAIVVLATNLPDALDPAVIREGRIDAKIEVKRPDKSAAAGIFAIHLRGKPISSGSCATLACTAADEMFSDKQKLLSVSYPGGETVFALRHIATGAMIQSVVEKAAGLAMQRDIKAGAISGIGEGDLADAIASCRAENAGVSHRDALAEFASGLSIGEVVDEAMSGGRKKVLH